MNRFMIPLSAALGAGLPLWIDSALKGVVLLALAGMTALGLRKASAATRHLVWLFAAVALLALPAFSTLLPGWRVLPAWTSMAVPAKRLPAAEARPMMPALPPNVTEPTPAVNSTVRVSAAPRVVVERRLSMRDWVLLTWAAGLSLLSTRLLVAFWVLSRTARRCAVAEDPRLIQLVEAARKQLGVRRPLGVLLDSRRTIPMVWGILRPRLLLPAEAVEWGASRLHSVLLHELAHVKRNDLAAQCLMQMTCALHWFNPLVWVAAWRLHVEGERACDNLVLASGVRASEYAEHLLHIATRLSPGCSAPHCGLAMARSSRLEGRLLAVLNDGLNRRGVTRPLALAALSVAVGVIIPVAMLRAAEEKKTQTPQSDLSVTGQPPEAVTQAGDALSPVVHEEREVLLIRLRRAEEVLKRDSELLRQNIISQAQYDEDKFKLEVLYAELNGGEAEVLRARFRHAEAEFQRVTKLYAEQMVSQQELDEARFSLDLLKAKLGRNSAKAADAEMQAAKAELAVAQARLKRISQLVDQKAAAEPEHEQAAAEVAAAQAKLNLAVARYEKPATGLAPKPVPVLPKPEPSEKVAHREVELAVAGVSVAKARLKRVVELVGQKLATPAELEMAEAELAKSEAQLRLAKAQYEKLRSPTKENAAEKGLSQPKKERLVQILSEEIQVAEDQAKLTREQHKAGTMTLEALMRAELDLWTLKRELAHLEGNMDQARDLIRQQLRAMEDLQNATREQRKIGIASEADELKLRREILSLKRQEAELE